MGGDARAARAEQVRAASRDHPVVLFAASTLIVDDAGFRPRDSTSQSVADKLQALGATDALVAAVLGLTDLAFVLRREGADAAADALLAALAPVQPALLAAIDAWPDDDAELGALRAERFAAFSQAPATRPAGKRPPGPGELSGGPLARLGAFGVAPKKSKKKDAP